MHADLGKLGEHAAPFVGRGEEIAVFDATLARLLKRQGGMMLLMGQPGIGKTRTARLFVERAQAAGATAAWGVAHEQEGLPPYWLWTQLLRDLLHADPSLRRRLEQSDIEALSLILPELRPKGASSGVDTARAKDGEMRFSLFDGVGRLLTQCAEQAPLLLAMDNLHLADTPSLRLLEFLGPELQRSAVLFLGTYRDVELSRGHPMSDMLARLASNTAFKRLRLRGFDMSESGALIRAALGHSPPYEIVAALHNQTEGNPFFLSEITRHIVEAGYLDGNGGGLPAFMSVPEGVREAVGLRLNRLSPRCNELLGLASVLGRQFDLSLLRVIATDFGEAEFLSCLGQAEDAQIVSAERDKPDHRAFAHALVRETLYDELPATRRIQVHAAAAQALEQRGGDLETLASLAHHCFSGQLITGADKVARHARAAADRALAITAYEDAAQFYRLAADALAFGAGAVPEKQLELKLLLGHALRHAGNVVDAMAMFMRAAEQAEALQSAESFAQAALAYEAARWRSGLPAETAIDLLLRALDKLTPTQSAMRARVLSQLAGAMAYSHHSRQAQVYAEEAVTLARGLGDAEVLSEALERAVLAHLRQPDSADMRLKLIEERLALSSTAENPEHTAAGLACACVTYMQVGRIEQFDRRMTELEGLTRRLRQPHYQYQVAMAKAGRALLAGEFAAAPKLAREAFQAGRRIGGSDAEGVFSMQMFAANRERGVLDQVAPLLADMAGVEAAESMWAPGLALLYAEIGAEARAGDMLAQLEQQGFSTIPQDDLWLTSMAFLADVCAVVDARSAARRLRQALAPYAGGNVVCGPYAVCFGPTDRLLGLLAGLEGDYANSTSWFESALAMAERLGSAPCRVRVQCDYAQTLLREGAPVAVKRAKQLLEECREGATSLGMGALEKRAATLQDETRRLMAVRGFDELTLREVEVLRLIAGGASNAEISRTLSISTATVATHVRNILSKTDSPNRTSAAAYARRHQLLP